jgi:hypothetical protein
MDENDTATSDEEIKKKKRKDACLVDHPHQILKHRESLKETV